MSDQDPRDSASHLRRPHDEDEALTRRRVSRRHFLGAGAAAATAGAALLVGLDALRVAHPVTSGLRARQLDAGAELRFDRARTRPGHRLHLDIELAADVATRRVRAVLIHQRPFLAGAPLPLGTVELTLEGGRGRAELIAPMSTLSAEERAREGYLLAALLVADDDASRGLLGEPVEVVVTPFVLGL